MKKIIHYLSWFILSAAVFQACEKDDDGNTNTSGGTGGTPSNPARDSVILDYNNNYLGSALSSSGWTGNTAGCAAGTCPQATQDKVIQRINYFRRMVGLNDNCTMDASKYAQEQEAALMFAANGALSHNPPTSWLCYTAAGATGAGSSNIAYGSHSVNAITMYMNDFGASNTAVGHRRWILHSTKTAFSQGSTNNTNALWVFQNGNNTIIPEFIAYPPADYVPQALVFARWSFGKPGANFSAATVTMKDASGASVNLTVLTVANGYGDNTIVWEPQGINTTSTSDVKYTVTVSGITGAPQSSYTYDVTIIKP